MHPLDRITDALAKLIEVEPDPHRSLNALAAQAPGWDGGSAAALSPQAVARAHGLLHLTAHPHLAQPTVVPNPNGTVSLEWSTGRGRVEVEVGATSMTLTAHYADSAFEGFGWVGDLPAADEDAVRRLLARRAPWE